MQLKRDTGLALSILMAFAIRQDPDYPAATLTLSRISEATGIPRQIALRICHHLVEAGYLEFERVSPDRNTYRSSRPLSDVTLLDIMQLTEGHSDLFSLFPACKNLDPSCAAPFAETNGKMDALLRSITVGQLLQD